MRSGKSAPDALKELLAKDEAREVRQVGMIDHKVALIHGQARTIFKPLDISLVRTLLCKRTLC
jgi:hypothetical protein